MLNRIISFSIWGADPLYWQGAIENIKLAAEIYPGWMCRIYHDGAVPVEAVRSMQAAGAQTRMAGKPLGDSWLGLFWRFNIACEEDVDAFIIRDADSRLNTREKAAVDEWLESGKPFHAMRDHHEHNVPIMGGMWGHRGSMRDFRIRLKVWPTKQTKGSDQTFLTQLVWPCYKDVAIVHDRYFRGMVMLPGDAPDSPRRIVPWDDMKDGPEEGQFTITEGLLFDRSQILYSYHPSLFGTHDVRPFPPHAPMAHGTHVGEIIRC